MTTPALKAAPQASKVAPGRPPAGYPIKPGQSGIARAAASRGNDPRAAPALPAPRPRKVPLTPVRQATAKSMLKLAAEIAAAHPQMSVHRHLADAASQVRAGNEEGALRHLRAAAYGLQPRSLRQHGIHDDGGHIAARQALEGVIRHHLLVKDIQDTAARNQAAISRDSYGDDTTSPPLPHSPLKPQRTVREPGGNQALNAPPVTSAGTPDKAVADPDSPQPKGSEQFARSWDEVGAVIGLSARTPMLESTPAPRGRPGGPGLYRLKGNKHSDYLEQVVKALIEKRGMPKAKAYAIAWGALRRWDARSKHPEVRAAASRGLIQEKEAAAKARAAHGHAVTWDDLGGVIDLAVVQVKTYQRTVQTKNGPRVETITTHPQNYKNGTGQPAPAGQPAAPQNTPQQQNQQNPAAQKRQLLARAASDRRQAALLGVQLAALYTALFNAPTAAGAGATAAAAGATAGAAGATAGAAGTTAAAAGATSAASAQQAAAAAVSAGATGAQVSQAAAAAQAMVTGMSAAQIQAAINQVQARITALNNQAAALTAQAAKL